MRDLQRVFLLLLIAGLSAFPAYGQDGQSLGDLARQARQKQQKDAPSKEVQPSRPARVISDEDTPAHAADSTPSNGNQRQSSKDSAPASKDAKMSAEQWKSQIQAQKKVVSSTQDQMDKLNETIRFAPANCVSGCVQWNERQKEKQQQVDKIRAQLEDQKKRLVDMQESARQQGYGNSVYDP